MDEINLEYSSLDYYEDFEGPDEGFEMVSGYSLKSIKWLFEQYAFENGRVHQEDARRTKLKIKEELYRRLDLVFDQLEQAENDADAERIYRHFIEH